MTKKENETEGIEKKRGRTTKEGRGSRLQNKVKRRKEEKGREIGRGR